MRLLRFRMCTWCFSSSSSQPLSSSSSSPSIVLFVLLLSSFLWSDYDKVAAVLGWLLFLAAIFYTFIIGSTLSISTVQWRLNSGISMYLLYSSATDYKVSFIFFSIQCLAGRSNKLPRLIYSANIDVPANWSHTLITAGIVVGSFVDMIEVPVTNIRFLSVWSFNWTALLNDISLHVLSIFPA